MDDEMAFNIRRAAEGAAVFVIVEVAGYLSGVNPMTELPIALGLGAIIYRQGLNSTDIQQVMGALGLKTTASTTTTTTTTAATSPAAAAAVAAAVAPAGMSLEISETNISLGDTIKLTVSGFTNSWTLMYGRVQEGVAITKPQTSGTLPYEVTGQSPIGDGLSVFGGTLPVFAQDANGNVSNVVTLTLN